MPWLLPDSGFAVESLGDLKPLEVLYEFGEPLIFTATSPQGRHLLAYASFSVDGLQAHADISPGEGFTRFVVAPTSPKIIAKLKKGAITIWDALDQPIIWAADVTHAGFVSKAAELHELSDIPADHLPARNRTLWPHLMPLLSYRLIGDGLLEGEIPASVVSRAVDGAIGALKKLMEVVRNVEQPAGRPTDLHRRDYDLTAQRFAFNSFEVSFAQGQAFEGDVPQDPDGFYLEAGSRLQGAFDWVADDKASIDELPQEMLDVLNKLIPPSQGIVREVEIQGRLLPRQESIRLTRADATRVRSAIARRRKRQRDLLDSEGRVRELDLDELTFMLRDRGAGASELKCSFIELLLDDVSEAFSSGDRVVVQGRLDNKGQLDISAIQMLPAIAPGTQGDISTG